MILTRKKSPQQVRKELHGEASRRAKAKSSYEDVVVAEGIEESNTPTTSNVCTDSTVPGRDPNSPCVWRDPVIPAAASVTRLSPRAPL